MLYDPLVCAAVGPGLFRSGVVIATLPALPPRFADPERLGNASRCMDARGSVAGRQGSILLADSSSCLGQLGLMPLPAPPERPGLRTSTFAVSNAAPVPAGRRPQILS